MSAVVLLASELVQTGGPDGDALLPMPLMADVNGWPFALLGSCLFDPLLSLR